MPKPLLGAIIAVSIASITTASTVSADELTDRLLKPPPPAARPWYAPSEDRATNALWYSLAGLSVADSVISHVAIQNGARETNPILGEKPGLPLLLAFNGLKVGAGWVIARYGRPTLARTLLGGLNAVTLGIVIHNTGEL